MFPWAVGFGQVLPRVVAGETDTLGGVSHGLREGFNGRLAEVQEFFAVVGFHLPLCVFFHGELNVDAVSVHAPGKVHLLAEQALTPCEHVDHGILSHSTDVPRARRVGWGCVDDEQFFAAVGIESIPVPVGFHVGVVGRLDGFLKVDGPAFLR